MADIAHISGLVATGDAGPGAAMFFIDAWGVACKNYGYA